MEMCTRVSGKMIRLMGMGDTCILMAPNMRDTGRKTSNMEKERRLGPMAHATKVTTSKARKMVTVDSNGQTDPPMKASSQTITSTEEVCMCGPITENMMVSGYPTKCMVKEYLLGQMEENMREIIMMIKSKVEVSLRGLTDVNMMENGTMESNTEKASITPARVKLDVENGKRESVSDGLPMKKIELNKQFYLLI